MYCPQCLTEYRDGFNECADCRVALMAGTPPPQAARDAAPVQVVVLETTDGFAVNLAKASLDDAGIGYQIDSRNTQRLYRVQVTLEDEEVARELMEPLLHPEDPCEEDLGS